ncbi:MAG TPA: enoyl-CoA hydratase/isomerase family protein, partial [Ilumatobacteraceae bacterium]|nr:enoyl-CoA hydratase/isomerase family protein [Ilumatobacteraceae bacterium]
MDAFTLTRDGHVLEVVLRHPTSPMNAVDALLHHEFGELFRTLKREREARVIVLVGEGKAFSAGGDFGWFPELRNMAALDELRRDAKQMIWDLLDVEVPIVCGLNGSAAGLGASIALLCDLIVMSERAVIIDPHVNVGLVAGDGGAAIWPLLLGPLAAKRHLLLGEPLTAVDAHRLGVASEVCPPADVRERAMAWARRIAAQPPLAVNGTKQAV